MTGRLAEIEARVNAATDPLTMAYDGRVKPLARDAAWLVARVRELEAALASLLGDFEWLLEQHPEHEGAYSDDRIRECRAVLAAPVPTEKETR